jgi:hypothetical protein
VPWIFAMSLPEAVLVFESRFDEAADSYAPEYCVYRLPASEGHRLDGSLDGLVEGLEPVGRIPVSDVEFDETRGLAIRTMGIERFADPS